MKRTHYVIYGVIFREHPEIIKIGRTTEEYVDLPAVESACIDGLSTICPLFRGSEWFKGTLDDVRRVVEDVLSAAQMSYLESSELRNKGVQPVSLRKVS